MLCPSNGRTAAAVPSGVPTACFLEIAASEHRGGPATHLAFSSPPQQEERLDSHSRNSRATAALIALDYHDAPYFRRTSSFNGFNNVFTGNATTVGMVLAPISLYVALITPTRRTSKAPSPPANWPTMSSWRKIYTRFWSTGSRTSRSFVRSSAVRRFTKDNFRAPISSTPSSCGRVIPRRSARERPAGVER
jgi:hypothetical protein